MEHIGNISRQRLLKITMFLSGLFYSYEQYYALGLILPLIWIANQFIFTSTCPYIVSRKYHLAQFYALKIWSGWKMLWKCFYLNCLGFEATGKPGRYLAFLGKLQIFQMVSIFIEHFKERNSKLNFPNLHVAEKLLSHQLCYACTRKSHSSSWMRGWPGRWACLIWLINCHNFPDHLPHHPDLREYVGALPSTNTHKASSSHLRMLFSEQWGLEVLSNDCREYSYN